MSKLDPSKIKKDFHYGPCRIRHCDVTTQIPISRTLPIYFSGAANCRPDPNYPPNVVIGTLARIGMQPPVISPILLQSISFFVGSFCKQFLQPLNPDQVDFYDWIEGTPYPRKRKDELIRVWESYLTDDPFADRKLTELKCFIKDETYPEYKAPRSINSRADWFKCYSGPLFQAIGYYIFHSSPDFIKTVPVLEQPADIIEALYDAFSPISNNDATSYEAHFIPVIMRHIEGQVYLHMCSKSQLYTQQMTKILQVLTGKQTLRFRDVTLKCGPFRMSGEMNTSLGNGLTTKLLVCFIAWIKQVIVKLRAEGDDNLSRWQNEESVPTEAEWRELGWVMKVERPDSVCTASFCGNVFDIEEQRVIVDPRSALLDFGWVRKPYVNASDGVLLQLMRSKALAMYHQYNGVPLLGKFGLHVIRLTEGVVIRKSVLNTMSLYDREEYLMCVKDTLPAYIEPTTASRLMVEELYGISYDEQIAFEHSVPDIRLWNEIELNFPCTQLTTQHYDNYTESIDTPWKCPLTHDHAEVERVLRSFGKITREFVEGYY